jgi:hypothetical protein
MPSTTSRNALPLSRERRTRARSTSICPPLVGCSGLLGTHLNQLPRSHANQDGKKIRYQRLKVGVPIALRDQHHDGQLEPTDILLEREIPIDGEEYVEVGLGQAQKIAVSFARPAHFWNGSGLVPDQIPLQALGQTLVKQDSHERATRPWPAPERRRPAPG